MFKLDHFIIDKIWSGALTKHIIYSLVFDDELISSFIR